MNIAKKLAELGYTLPAPPKPIAAYLPAVHSGNLLFVSGQLPMREGKLIAVGLVPSAISLEEAGVGAAQCAVNALAIVGAELGGDFSRLVRVIRIGVFVQSDAGFSEQSKVANGASELLLAVLGESGRHARAALGVNALPMNAAVEAEFLFQVKD